MFDLGHSFDDVGCALFPRLVFGADGVARECDGLYLWQVGELADLIPHLDLAVRNQEGVKLDAWVQTLQLIDVVVGNPELLKRLTDLIKAGDPLDVVPAKRENFQVLQLRQVDDPVDLVR